MTLCKLGETSDSKWTVASYAPVTMYIYQHLKQKGSRVTVITVLLCAPSFAVSGSVVPKTLLLFRWCMEVGLSAMEGKINFVPLYYRALCIDGDYRKLSFYTTKML